MDEQSSRGYPSLEQIPIWEFLNMLGAEQVHGAKSVPQS